MDNGRITNQQELLTRLSELKREKAAQEQQLKETYHEIIATLDFVSAIRSFTGSLKGNSIGFAKTAFGTIVDIVIGFIFGGKRGFRGFLSTVFAEMVTFLLMGDNISKVFSWIKDFFGKNEENNTESSAQTTESDSQTNQ